MRHEELERSLRDAIVFETTPPAALLTPLGAMRIGIHRTHFATSLTQALETVYPAIVSLVDQRFFAYCADTFLRSTPPRTPCLFEYGAAFPGFLATFPACAGLPYLADVARLEWAMHEVFHAPDRETAAPPSDVRLLASAFPIHRIWRTALVPGADPVHMNDGGVNLAVYRANGDVTVEELDDAAFKFLVTLILETRSDAMAATAQALDPVGVIGARISSALIEHLIMSTEPREN